MADLDPILQVELLRWRAVERNAGAAGRAAGEGDTIRQKTVRVFVRSDLDDAALRGLGLDILSRSKPYIIGSVALADLERLAAAPGVEEVLGDRRVHTQLDGTVPQIRAPAVWNQVPGYKGRNVIIGIIDTGIDIFHEDFRLADKTKTRIESIWDQNLPGTPATRPAPFTYGVEYVRAQIEQEIANPDGGIVPHRDAPTIGLHAAEAEGGHGTHVASIAAGDGSADDRCDGPFTFIGVAPEAELIVVAVAGGGQFITDAVNYIFRRATTPAPTQPPRPPRPAVINISLGNNIGAHDGTDPFDVALDDLLNVTPTGGNPVPLPRRALVVSAGNEGNKRRHASKQTDAGGLARFDIDMEATERRPSSTTPEQIEAWFDGATTLALTIDGPPSSGTTSAAAPFGGPPLTISGNTVTVSLANLHTNGQRHVLINIAPGPNPTVTLGRWTLRFSRTAGPQTTIDVWIERIDDDIRPQFTEADAVRDNTIMLPGTCQSAITVTSYDPDRIFGLGDLDLSDFSPRGVPAAQLRPGQRMKPDLAAPGEDIMAANSGVTRDPPCCRCCNFRHKDQNGASAAAPHVAGVAALIFEKNRNLSFAQVRAHLQVAARRDEIPSSEVPPVLPGAGGIGTPGEPDFMPIHQNHFWGSGRLDALVAVNTVPPESAGGGGGSGGGIDAGDPALERPPRTMRWGGWPPSVREHPAFQLFAALVSTHVDEVRRLIDTNKRVAAVWRHGGGPTIVRHLLDRSPDAQPLLPVQVEDFPLAALLDRLMNVFARFGSDALKNDVARWRDLVRAVPGSDLDALDARLDGMRP